VRAKTNEENGKKSFLQPIPERHLGMNRWQNVFGRHVRGFKGLSAGGLGEASASRSSPPWERLWGDVGKINPLGKKAGRVLGTGKRGV